VLATYAWDNLGRRTSLTRGDGSVLSYGYDAVSRLTQLADNLTGTAYDQTLGFGYTPASQIASNTRSNDAYAWTGHYNLNRNYTANGRNQYTAVASITPTYDTKGNLTSAGSTTYAYTSENLLTSASGGITLAYDPAMRLYQTSGGSAGATRFAYEGTDLIAEYNGSNAMLRRYVHGPGADEPLVWYEGSGTGDRRFLHADERGSIVAVTNSSGTTLNVNGYNEYGIPSSGNGGRFRYTGQTWLSELGMYYYKARIYSPTLGRFLQTDPIGYGDGMNIYAYVKGDPVNATDPSGRCQLVDVGYSWYSSSGEYLGPAPGKYYVLRNCAGDLGGSGSFGSGSQVGIGSDGGSSEGETITITGQPPAPIPTLPVIPVALYNGPHFCDDPSVGQLNRFNPLGRINSGKIGGAPEAKRDLNAIATLNGIVPTSQVYVTDRIFNSATNFPVPFPIGYGWYLYRNPFNDYHILGNRGLQYRHNMETHDIRLDIPAGFLLPNGDRLTMNETCHYN
jgi:RHS repeat-associated protein